MIAPYGSWSSPVTVDMMTTASVGLGSPRPSGGRWYWAESRADEGGRISLWRQDADGTRIQLTPAPFYVRSMVHEYGGGAWDVAQSTVVFSHLADGRVYRSVDGGGAEPITPESRTLRYADLRVHPDRDLVLAVREDHDPAHPEPVASIVALSLNGGNEEGGTVLCSGADFYSTPELSSTGGLAWTEWDHPNMPWDSTRIMLGRLVGAGVADVQQLADVTQVAGGPDESAVQPRWTGDGRLLFISDRADWWNLYSFLDGETTALHPLEAEFAQPQWMLGDRPYAVVDDDRVLCRWTHGGSEHLGLLTLSSGTLKEQATGAVAVDSIAVDGDTALLALGYADRPAGLSRLDLSSGELTEFRRSSDATLPEGSTSLAEEVSWSTPAGPVYGLYYPPTNAGFSGPDGELPPLIVRSHGGPTQAATAEFSASYQYWTSRGFAMLDVNYGGSTGFGRQYRNRLRGGWGVVDVEDCAAGARAMVEQGRADPRRLAIVGGSAGGYTTLRALTTTDVFTAGISLYGIGDLEALAKDTHKFESRYPDGLVGPYPEAVETYRQRSPINHVDRLSCPILLIQGLDDKVVPPNQSMAFAEAARDKGLPVGLLMFEGEGHGFRKAENIRRSIEAQLYFLGRVFGFQPADRLDGLPIDNLP
ncbi:S9 family peptidase [Microlunatus panaciterrae]|uniref:Dipeptidyl aminopeptidase/acylaminoacyl peptidase n=1 Tax=Microlunatus panaciterrae TaxID=400768 RepID=A0ABS2RF32_9ACTN|nr:prolyl oligopeptidase family serine peptidase [Microlunatus panaciterrae]MBM7797608.1 dipeptidyl aminopeptidase/acylaminoacyl peptidase [Microlunatus panaciterrae]